MAMEFNRESLNIIELQKNIKKTCVQFQRGEPGHDPLVPRLGIYRLKVQTPGVEEELKSLDDLWKCAASPEAFFWEQGPS